METRVGQLRWLQGKLHPLNTFRTSLSTLEMLYRRYEQRINNVFDSKTTNIPIDRHVY